MSVLLILLIILFFLMVVVGEERGIKSFFSIVINFTTLFVMLELIINNYEPIKTTIIACFIISSVTLFYSNGFHKKTFAALFSVIIVVLLTIAVTYNLTLTSKIQGFGIEQADSIEYLSLYVNIDFTKLVVCEIIIGLIGAVTDTAITISSSINEILLHNPDITRKDLFKSGMNIGKDILGTTTNTLLFAYLGGFMTMLIWFKVKDNTIPEIINSKIFCSEVFQIFCSGIGVLIIIPITALVAIGIYTLDNKNTCK